VFSRTGLFGIFQKSTGILTPKKRDIPVLPCHGKKEVQSSSVVVQFKC